MHKSLEALPTHGVPQAAQAIVSRGEYQRAVAGVRDRRDGVAVRGGNSVQPVAVPEGKRGSAATFKRRGGRTNADYLQSQTRTE